MGERSRETRQKIREEKERRRMGRRLWIEPNEGEEGRKTRPHSKAYRNTALLSEAHSRGSYECTTIVQKGKHADTTHVTEAHTRTHAHTHAHRPVDLPLMGSVSMRRICSGNSVWRGANLKHQQGYQGACVNCVGCQKSVRTGGGLIHHDEK